MCPIIIFPSPPPLTLGTDGTGQPIFLRDIWPSRTTIQDVERRYVLPAMFKEVYSKITAGNDQWNSLVAPESLLYPWDETSTYIKSPPFLENMVSTTLYNTSLYINFITSVPLSTSLYRLVSSPQSALSRKQLCCCILETVSPLTTYHQLVTLPGTHLPPDIWPHEGVCVCVFAFVHTYMCDVFIF